MCAVSAQARSDYSFFSKVSPDRSAASGEKLQNALQSLYPDLLVHGTRNCLLSMTTALTKVSSRTHQYFARVSQILAFERMMRSFMQFAAAASPFPLDQAVKNCWQGLLSGQANAIQPWGYSTALSKQPSAMPFLTGFFPAGALPSSAPQPWSGYNALFMVPVALIAAVPGLDNWWNFAA